MTDDGAGTPGLEQLLTPNSPSGSGESGIHAEDQACRAPRITAELNDGAPAGERVNHKRVAWVMGEHGIAGHRRRRVRTT